MLIILYYYRPSARNLALTGSLSLACNFSQSRILQGLSDCRFQLILTGHSIPEGYSSVWNGRRPGRNPEPGPGTTPLPLLWRWKRLALPRVAWAATAVLTSHESSVRCPLISRAALLLWKCTDYQGVVPALSTCLPGDQCAPEQLSLKLIYIYILSLSKNKHFLFGFTVENGWKVKRMEEWGEVSNLLNSPRKLLIVEVYTDFIIIWR